MGCGTVASGTGHYLSGHYYSIDGDSDQGTCQR